MSRAQRTPLLPVFAALLVGALAFGGPGFAQPRFAEVTLTYVKDGNPCITVDPEVATINWDKRPRKVRWVSASSTDLYWEIEWKGSERAGGQPNYFGKKFKIKRGKKDKDSDKPQKHSRNEPGASWPYMVRVYETSATVERGALLCELDPVIDWGD